MQLTCVTATFNCIKSGNRDSLARCIDSVSNLEIEHEHLIYDGASTDGTYELLRDLTKSRQCVKVVSEKDTGIYNAFNKGVRDANGDWLYFLGSDDFIISKDELAAALEQGVRANADVIAAPVSIDSSGHVIGCYFRSIFGAMPFPHQGLLMTTKVVKKLGGFDEQFHVAADYDLLLRALMEGCRVSHWDKAFSYFSRTGVSSTVINVLEDEILRLLAKNLHIQTEALRRGRKKRLLPLRVCVKLLSHRSAIVRKSARYQLARYILDVLGLIDDNGIVKIKL